MSAQSPHLASPVMNTKQAAAYVHRTPNAMKILRHRRKGPKSFEQGGRIYYYVAELDRWLAAGAASDSRSNAELDPTTQAPEARPSRRARKLSPAPVKSAA
ncbi:DNA-binding protein [Streptomyces sp. NEAU-174]|uniref:DNA-binding protein n=1 Tax=Streptomyces sp. NEAU-174 TaxID=3458254 RepID=UPI0040448928